MGNRNIMTIFPLTQVPLTVPGVVSWFDAADTATITESGGSVSSVRNKANSQTPFTQGTALNQPVTGTRTINGLNVLDFDGVNSTLSFPSVFSDFTNGQASCFVVAKADTAGTTKTIVGSNSTARFYCQQGTADQYIIRYGGTNVTVGGVVSTNGIVYFTYDGATDGYSAKVNSSASIATGTTSITGVPGGLTLGNRSGVGEYFDGVIGEYIAYNRLLSGIEIISIVIYLSNKWGISIS
jgi:hypothetical protein